MISPVKELWDSSIRTISLEFINLFNLETLFSGKVIMSVISFLIKLDEMFLVYFGSISLPDQLLVF